MQILSIIIIYGYILWQSDYIKTFQPLSKIIFFHKGKAVVHMVKQCWLCIEMKNHRTSLVKAPYSMHTKGNIAKIV